MSKKSVVVTARVDADLADRIDALAGKLDRSRAWIAAKALDRYVAEQSEFLAFLQEGEDAIERGDYLTHDELVAEIRASRQQKNAA